ncbi:uncharacterized protein LOC126569430 [Anopheles aquasalis]|uniref:uncharacterized protein LOC126569430 n=1 Tax=Anopheles aquasalis TaxID=42839 RepID=UPI00215AD5CA|nr:uncharacterized protein LOC126569430 [Anopheles aquasalis]
MAEVKYLQYCNFYKPILVEEMLLVDHPSLLHNGKCSAIGELACDEDKLLSLMVPYFPESVQLEDGIFAIDISFRNYRGRIPRRGAHVEVCGTVMLYDTQSSGEMDSTTTSGFLREQLMETDDVAKLFQEMHVKYKPFIEVEFINQVANARQLIACNLRMRGLQPSVFAEAAETS